MINQRHRKYPIVHEKQHTAKEDTLLSLDIKIAVGIVAAAFVQGLLIGYILKRKN